MCRSRLLIEYPLPTFIDETTEMYDSIIVSGGRVGLQVELTPKDLARITSAVFCDLSLYGNFVIGAHFTMSLQTKQGANSMRKILCCIIRLYVV